MAKRAGKPTKKRPPLPLLALRRRGDPDGKALAAIRRYVESGVDINDEIHGPQVNYETLLHLAAACQQVAIMEYLLERGAEVNVVSGTQDTPLTLAASYSDDPAAVALLLRHGADVNGCGELKNETALEAASVAGHPRVAKLLLEHGAELRDALKICNKQLRRKELADRHDSYRQVKQLLEDAT